MRYVVYEKKSGKILRTYRKLCGESGELLPATEDEILGGLPPRVSREALAFLTVGELPVERGKTYRVDVKTRRLVEQSARR